MATPFTDIYSKFLGKISDYSFLNMTDQQIENRCYDLLIAAIPRFKRCKKNLSLRNNKVEFEENLTDEEQEILATRMVVEWLNPQINSIELLKQHLSSKDWSMYSQANHLRELRELRKDAEHDFERMMTDYTYTSNSLDDLK